MKTWADFGISLPSNRGGAEQHTTCPQCSSARKKANQRKPCLQVNVEKEVWFCHHCGWTGTLKKGVDRAKYESHWNAPEYIRPLYTDSKGLSPIALEWFGKRGIDKDVLERNKITSGMVYMPQVGDHVNAIQYPFYRGGECINVKYRDHQKNFRMEGRAERIFYGLDDMQEWTIIVEGEMDKLAIEMAGMLNCVSVPDGAPAADSKNYNSKFEFLENCKAELDKVKQFIIAVDSDAPGRRLEEELVHRFGKNRCAIVRWPAGCKDANDVLLKHGAEELSALIYNAEPPPIEGVVRVRDRTAQLEQYYERGSAPGLYPGWNQLNNHYRISTAEWTLVTGIPGHGKSEWLDALLINLANEHNWSFGIYSPENSNVEQHIAKLIEKKVAKAFQRLGEWGRMSPEEMREGAEWVDEHFYFLDLDDENNLSLERILELTKELIFQHGIKGLVIDPWNELEHQRPGHLTETEYISQCLSKVRNFVRTHNIHIWIVAHPTKLQKSTSKDGKENYPVPTAYDVAGSANWRNKAFNCISVWRDVTDENSATQIHVQKIKFKKNGKLGKVDLSYDKITGRYIEIKPICNF